MIIDQARAGSLPNPFTARDMYRNQGSGLSDRAAVADALDLLAAHGWQTETTIDTVGRSTTTYALSEGARRGKVGRATGRENNRAPSSRH